MSLKNSKRNYQPISILKKLFILFIIFSVSKTNAQQVSEVITDFGGFWKSGTGAAINPTYPNTSHNVLSFKYNSVVYSTGVDDSKLTANSITYTAGDFRAFPVATVGGTITASSIYIALASRYDGVPNGYSSPLPSLRIKDVLIDGIHGLDLGTGATNIPASALINFPISTVNAAAISDAKPDIVVSQIAQPTSTGDTLYFIDNSGTVVGNKLAINWTTISTLGTYYLDLYSLPIGTLCDTAHVTGTFDKETTREIRLLAFKLSDFGITAGNSTNVTGFILKASGTSDPAFIAYNNDAFTIPAPVITVQPVTQVVCPNVSSSATFSVTATGGSLSYQWRKNNVDITGATNSTYTISNVTSSSAGAYNVVVSNPVGSVASNFAYLNISVAVQPSPSAQVIATGASCTLSISANNATGYQWRKAGVDISGATSSSYTINPVNTADTASYSVRVINSAGGGCANVTSNTVVVTGSKTLYSKSSGNLNLPATWGVATDGSGSSPVDFTRSEHTFIVKNNAATGGNLTIAGTLDVANAVTTITAGTTLDVNKIIRSGTGALAGTATSNLTVRDTSNLYFQSGNDIIKNFSVQAGNINLLSTLSITAGSAPGSVTLNGGTFNTNDNLTFKSDASGTARLATIASGATINGKATIERYIPAARGWRYLSVPITSTGAPTINQAWQEGVTTASSNTNPNPGYGGFITGGTTANGFDQSLTNFASIKTFDATTHTFVRLPASPGTNIPITNYPAYCIYFRGDRSINLMQGLGAAITSTTLRMKGQMKTGNQAVSIDTAYTFVGNPYPSAIDFATLTRSNVSNTFYVWDPKMAGTNGLGGYVTLSWNNSTHVYDKTSSISSVSQYIQSGEAFFVRSSDRINTGTLTFKETDKTNLGSDQVYRTQGVDQSIRVNLYAAGTNDSTFLLDGVLTTYADDNSNEVDNDDPIKLWSSNQSINIKRNDQFLAMERRKTISGNDTTFLNLYQMRAQDYKLEVIAANMNIGNTTAVLKDNYSNTTNNLLLDMNGITMIPFTVNADPASYAINRFSIVFESHGILPVTFKKLKAYQNKNDILVEWNTENEINITGYNVESSLDGQHFTTSVSVSSKAGNGGAADYSWLDKNPIPGIHYYRIMSMGLAGEKNYSEVVKVNIAKQETANDLIVYPNPVENNIASLQLPHLEKGMYTIMMTIVNGQMIKRLSIVHNGGAFKYNFPLEENLPVGKYQVKLSGGKINYITSFIK
ncbi:MAG: hypothetical protein QM737_12200 [Ferruginibacter sp.]